MTSSFSRTFVAQKEHIDELGHVNNSVWVQWIQDLATAHWESAAAAEHRDQYFWVVIRHEIDYRGNIGLAETTTGTTWIPDPPKGAKSDRRVDFVGATGKVIVSARTTWAMLDRQSERLVRVRPEVMRPFNDGV